VLRYLFAIAASLVLSVCVVQPPPGYWKGFRNDPLPKESGSTSAVRADLGGEVVLQICYCHISGLPESAINP
jgi:hypothetical protein